MQMAPWEFRRGGVYLFVLPCRWSNVRTGCPERLLNFHSWTYLKLDQARPGAIWPNWPCFEQGLSHRTPDAPFWTTLLNELVILHVLLNWELRLVTEMYLLTFFPPIGHTKRLCVNFIEVCNDIWFFNFLFAFTLFLKTKRRTINDNHFIALTHLLNHISFQNVLSFLYFISKFAYCPFFSCSENNSELEMPGGAIIIIIYNHLPFPPTTQII